MPLARTVIRTAAGPKQRPGHLTVKGQLFVELDDGSRVRIDGSISVGGPRRGLGAIWERYDGPITDQDELDRTYRVAATDVEQALRVLVAEDRHPADWDGIWEDVSFQLAAHGVLATSEQLAAAPLAVEFDDALLEELALTSAH